MAMRREEIDKAQALIQSFVDRGEVQAAALLVRQGRTEISRGFGKARADTPFLLASITKPMTAAGIMILRDRGELSLQDPVRRYLPEFDGKDRAAITLKHVLTHTSGLPDMVPDNEELRKRHAPLSEFVASTCRTPLLFEPGSKLKYQSMGILLASAVAERVTKTPFRDFLRKELYGPLGMRDTSLGLGGRKIADTARCQVPAETDWDWNSPYWRDFGAPWGGAHSTVKDVAAFLDAFHGDPPIWKPGTSKEMISNQTAPLKDPWGIGWMIKPGTFGRACSARTYGHFGSTGTVAWSDPESKLSLVLLTTKPASDSRAGLLGPVGDLVSESATQGKH